MIKHRIAGVLLAMMGTALINMPVGQCVSLSLEDAVAMAIANNPDVALTRYGEDEARAALRQKRGANSFSVTAGSEFSKSERDNDGWVNDNSQSIKASLPIYSGGANEANIKSAEIGVDAAKLTTARKYETMRLNVVKAYFNALEAQKQVDIDQDSVDKYEKHLTNVEQLYSAGSKAKIDVLRSSVELSDARQTLIKSQATYDNCLFVLRNYLYLDQNEPVVLTDDFQYKAFLPTASECVDYAFANRKDLQVDEYSVKQKELAVKAAKGGWLPSANLNLSTSWDDQVLPAKDNHSLSGGVGISWNIFDSGVTQGKVDAAKVALEKAKLTLLTDKNDIEMNLRQNYNSMREAEKRFETTQNAVKEAEEDYFIASEKYNAGEGIMLDIIDAQVALSTARQNYISAQYDYIRYKAAVENDMGLDEVANADKAE